MRQNSTNTHAFNIINNAIIAFYISNLRFFGFEVRGTVLVTKE
jgi:hypothetical protein